MARRSLNSMRYLFRDRAAFMRQPPPKTLRHPSFTQPVFKAGARV